MQIWHIRSRKKNKQNAHDYRHQQVRFVERLVARIHFRRCRKHKIAAQHRANHPTNAVAALSQVNARGTHLGRAPKQSYKDWQLFPGRSAQLPE